MQFHFKFFAALASLIYLTRSKRCPPRAKQDEWTVREILCDLFGMHSMGTPRNRSDMSTSEALQVELFGDANNDDNYYPEEPHLPDGGALGAVWLKFPKKCNNETKRLDTRTDTSEGELFIIQHNPDRSTKIIGWVLGVAEGYYGITITQWAQTEKDKCNQPTCEGSGAELPIDGDDTIILLNKEDGTLNCSFHDATEQWICVVNFTGNSLPLWGAQSIIGRVLNFISFDDDEHVENRAAMYFEQHLLSSNTTNTTTLACGVVGIANDFTVMQDDRVNIVKDQSQRTFPNFVIVLCILSFLINI